MTIKDIYEQYRGAVSELRTFTESIGDRELNEEENATEQRINASVTSLQARINQALDVEDRARETAEIDRRMTGLALATVAPPAAAANTEEAQIRSFLAGETRSLVIRGATRDNPRPEQRDLIKGTNSLGGFTVPTGFYDQLMAHLIEVSGIMMAGPTVLRTTSGENILVPKTTGHGTAALVAEAAAIAESDETFAQATLSAYKYGKLSQVSSELVQDTAVDLLGYLAMTCGRAVGNAFGVHAITGTGSAQPAGIVTGSTLGVTGGTGVAGVFTADNLIDLFYSVIAPYRASASCAWLMRDATVATVRKLKDTTNQYLWQPSIQIGAPEILLGKPVYTDPNIAATAVNAKSVIFGDISQYFVRMVNDIRFERSDEYAFNQDLVTFRCLIRADGVLVDQTGAVKHYVGAAT